MYEDDPQDKVFDVLGEAVFGDAPAGPRDPRPRRRRRRHAGRRACAPSTARATCRATSSSRRRARSTTTRWSTLVRQRSELAAAGRPGCRTAGSDPAAAPDFAPARPLHREGHRAVPRLPRRAGHRARRRAPLRAARARQHPRRHVVVAAVPGGAREARAGLLGLLVQLALRGDRAGRPVRRDAARQRRHGARRDRRRARALPRERPRRADELDALQGERQGPRAARAGVHDRAHEPARRLAAGRACRCCRSTRSRRASTPSRSTTSPRWRPSCSIRSDSAPRGSAPTRTRSAPPSRRAPRSRGRMTRVGVAGAAGRMGQTVCVAVEGADDLELVARDRSRARRRAVRRARRLRRDRRLHAARHGAGQRAGLRRRRRARRRRHERLGRRAR